jgi:hypothetical protein
MSRVGYVCNYDDCFADNACAMGQVCVCGSGSGALGRTPNRCLTGNCQVDADCGGPRFCSPSLDPTCGTFTGVVGYFCHTPQDTCYVDSDCGPPDGSGASGFCAYQPAMGHWACSYGVCSG